MATTFIIVELINHPGLIKSIPSIPNNDLILFELAPGTI